LLSRCWTWRYRAIGSSWPPRWPRPQLSRVHAASGRVGNPARNRWARCDRTPRASVRRPIRWPSGHRRRVRAHYRWLRCNRFRPAVLALCSLLLPLNAITVGMGMSDGPASSAATASVSADQVGAAFGVSNMARYVGAAVATALAATHVTRRAMISRTQVRSARPPCVCTVRIRKWSSAG
jgi:hypothetical protein